MNPNRSRSTIIYVLLFAAIIILVFYSFNQNSSSQETLSINQVAADIQNGKISRIVEEQDRLVVIYGDGSDAIEKTSHKETETTLVHQLKDLGVSSNQLVPEKIIINVKPPSPWLGVASAMGYILPFIILGGVFWFVFRQAQGSNNAAMSFGKSRARMFTGDQPSVTIGDVAGVEEAKEELQEVVEFLREPEELAPGLPGQVGRGGPLLRRAGAAAGPQLWDGKDEAGLPLPDGIYRYWLVVTDQEGREITGPTRSVEIFTTGPQGSVPVEPVR